MKSRNVGSSDVFLSNGFATHFQNGECFFYGPRIGFFAENFFLRVNRSRRHWSSPRFRCRDLSLRRAVLLHFGLGLEVKDSREPIPNSLVASMPGLTVRAMVGEPFQYGIKENRLT